jgi:hypothetical protein
MNEITKQIKSDKIIKWSMGFAGLLLIIEAISIGIFYFSLPPLIPLFNQMPWGESRLAAKTGIFLPVLIATSFFFLNFFLLIKLYEKIPLISRMLSITTLLITLLSATLIFHTFQLIL